MMITEPITYDEQVTSPLHKDNTQGGICHALNTDSRNYVVIPLGSDGQAKREHSETEKYKCYAISAYNSGSMKSSNPHNGVYETTISRILDSSGGNPACNQGGVIILERKKTQRAVAYTLKIRSGCDTYIRWDGKKGSGGKGALIQIEKSATLAVAQDQVLFQPADVRGGEQRER